MSKKAATFSDGETPPASDITELGPGETAGNDRECHFRILCERSLAGIYIVQDGCIKYANPAVAQILGCEPEKLNGASPLDFVHPDDRAHVEETHAPPPEWRGGNEPL